MENVKGFFRERVEAYRGALMSDFYSRPDKSGIDTAEKAVVDMFAKLPTSFNEMLMSIVFTVLIAPVPVVGTGGKEESSAQRLTNYLREKAYDLSVKLEAINGEVGEEEIDFCTGKTD